MRSLVRTIFGGGLSNLSRILRIWMRFVCCGMLLAALAQAQTLSSITLTPSPSPSSYGQAVTLTAAVTTGATGKVTFYDGTTVLGTSTISASQAMLTSALLPSGSRSLRVLPR
jgi:hypothetical protein